MSALTRRLAAATTALAAVGAVSVTTLPAADAATSCRVRWGSQNKAINLSSPVTGTPVAGRATVPAGAVRIIREEAAA